MFDNQFDGKVVFLNAKFVSDKIDQLIGSWDIVDWKSSDWIFYFVFAILLGF